MSAHTIRLWAVRWTYASAAAHLLVAVALPWIAGLALLDGYHGGIEAAFWGGAAPAAARAQQLWWITLFGATMQSVAIWMGALTWIGDRERSAVAWGALIAGIVVWAPQDMAISLRADCWPHVWLDCFIVVTMLPPLLWLLLHDRRRVAA
ncbi:hypothetical protein ACFDR9_001981 [Janthinobacterium sp. CG_23.3]|uniref:cell division protein n=1 Tax=Janthinobacterium sp. CG_23.3 TaxID=3349634 RepID=UPI0038D49650